MNIGITAIGTANPSYKRTQEETAELISNSLFLKPSKKRLLRAIYKATGINERYSVLSDYERELGQFEFFPNTPDEDFPKTSARMNLYKQSALPLALSAIQNCLGESIDSKDITHLITVSCTGMYAPGLDIELIASCKFASSIKRTVINFMGCYGVFNAIKVAEAFCKADPRAKVLIVSVELCTLHFQKNIELDNIISNAIFADGAGALVIETSGDRKSLHLEHFFCDVIPQSHQEMTWHIADFGFDIVLSSYVPDVIQSGILAFREKLLTQKKLQAQQIDFYAIHPGGIKILQACESALNITKDDNKFSYEVLKNYGNMSSATVIFILNLLWQTLTRAHHQKRIFSCAFGPGLTLESMLLKINYA